MQHSINTDLRPCLEWRPVIKEICKLHRVGWNDIIRGTRLPHIIAVRFEIWWTIHDRFGTSYEQIGKRTGGYHHTTVMHGIRKWQQQLNRERAQEAGDKRIEDGK